MATKTRMLGVLLVLMTAGVPAAAQDDPKIAARDVLTINVWPASDMSRSYMVDPQGMIDFPELGRVRAAGLTTRELEDALIKRLVDAGILLNPNVAIALDQHASHKIIVAGEGVMNPGEISFAGELHIQEALLRAGSTTIDAAADALVVRPGDTPEDTEIITVNLRELQGANVAEHNILLRDGDRVIVNKAAQVFITGYVGRQGAYTVRPGMMVEQALALAGGPSTLGATNRITIKRTNADGDLEEIDVELTDPVQPGDTINVPRRRI